MFPDLDRTTRLQIQARFDTIVHRPAAAAAEAFVFSQRSATNPRPNRQAGLKRFRSLPREGAWGEGKVWTKTAAWSAVAQRRQTAKTSVKRKKLSAMHRWTSETTETTFVNGGTSRSQQGLVSRNLEVLKNYRGYTNYPIELVHTTWTSANLACSSHSCQLLLPLPVPKKKSPPPRKQQQKSSTCRLKEKEDPEVWAPSSK